MRVIPEFPEHRREDPTRQAEFRVYQELVNSDRPGYALYEIKPISRVPELDYAVWLEGVGVFGIQVKGGQVMKEGSLWLLHTVDGTEEMPCPIQRTWDASLAVKTVVKRRMGRRPYVLPVLLFPDMLPDPVIQHAVDHDGRVSLLWGEEDLVERLIALPATDEVYNPPDAGQIAAEVAAVRPPIDLDASHEPDHGDSGPVRRRPHTEEDSRDVRGRMDMTARQVVIQRADLVNIYTVEPVEENPKG